VTSNTGPFGLFRYTVETGTWWWSEPVYEIHGFTPGEVVPTTELIMSHKHPEDADEVAASLKVVLTEGAPFSSWHRIVDARSRIRQVVSVGEGVRDGSGRLAEIRGWLVDLTEPKRRSLTTAIDEAVRASARSRAEIEQAKGVLMREYALTAEDAFSLLRRYSQHTNVKLREVATRMVDAVARVGAIPAEMRDTCDRLRAEADAQPMGAWDSSLAAEPSPTTRGDRTAVDGTGPDAEPTGA
jgi:hypothetical protein